MRESTEKARIEKEKNSNMNYSLAMQIILETKYFQKHHLDTTRIIYRIPVPDFTLACISQVNRALKRLDIASGRINT